jgi:hypothetical protein
MKLDLIGRRIFDREIFVRCDCGCSILSFTDCGNSFVIDCYTSVPLKYKDKNAISLAPVELRHFISSLNLCVSYWKDKRELEPITLELPNHIKVLFSMNLNDDLIGITKYYKKKAIWGVVLRSEEITELTNTLNSWLRCS